MIRSQHVEGGADDLRPDVVARQDEETGRSGLKLVAACFGSVCRLLRQGRLQRSFTSSARHLRV
jgi:hypothetical protein